MINKLEKYKYLEALNEKQHFYLIFELVIPSRKNTITNTFKIYQIYNKCIVRLLLLLLLFRYSNFKI